MTHVEPPGQQRRLRRANRRRQEILAAAAAIIAEKGYSGATTKEIADAADVAEGTLYNYFSGKREILLAIASEAEKPVEDALLQAGRLENREGMVALFEQALNVTEARLPFIRALLTEAWTDDDILQDYVTARLSHIARLVEVFISERVVARVFRPIDPALGARLAMGMFGGLVLPIMRGVEPLPGPEQRRVLAETVVDLLLDGIRVRTG